MHCLCVGATLIPCHQAYVGAEEFLVSKRRDQFAIGQHLDGGIIGVLQGFRTSHEVAGKYLRVGDVAIAYIQAERLLHEVVRVIWGIRSLEPGLARNIGGEGPRLGDAVARCCRILHDGLNAEGGTQGVNAQYGCPLLSVKKTEVAESGFSDDIRDAAGGLGGPFDVRRRHLLFGETGERDSVALMHPLG